MKIRRLEFSMDQPSNLDFPESYCNILKFLQQEFIEFLRVFSFRDKSDDFKKELIKDYYDHVESVLSWLPGSGCNGSSDPE